MPDSLAAGAAIGFNNTHVEAGVASSFAPPPFPLFHGVTRADLMIRDPQSLYAYWELAPEFREMTARHFNCCWDDLPLILRLYMLEEDRQPVVVQEVHATRLTDNWFFHHLSPGRTYVLDVGTRNVYDVFVALLRSNQAQTPRNWAGYPLVRLKDEEWEPENLSSPFHFRS